MDPVFILFLYIVLSLAALSLYVCSILILPSLVFDSLKKNLTSLWPAVKQLLWSAQWQLLFVLVVKLATLLAFSQLYLMPCLVSCFTALQDAWLPVVKDTMGCCCCCCCTCGPSALVIYEFNSVISALRDLSWDVFCNHYFCLIEFFQILGGVILKKNFYLGFEINFVFIIIVFNVHLN